MRACKLNKQTDERAKTESTRKYNAIKYFELLAAILEGKRRKEGQTDVMLCRGILINQNACRALHKISIDQRVWNPLSYE